MIYLLVFIKLVVSPPAAPTSPYSRCSFSSAIACSSNFNMSDSSRNRRTRNSKQTSEERSEWLEQRLYRYTARRGPQKHESRLFKLGFQIQTLPPSLHHLLKYLISFSATFHRREFSYYPMDSDETTCFQFTNSQFIKLSLCYLDFEHMRSQTTPKVTSRHQAHPTIALHYPSMIITVIRCSDGMINCRSFMFTMTSEKCS